MFHSLICIMLEKKSKGVSIIMDLVVATKNEGKLSEIIHLLEGLCIRVMSLKDYPEIGEIAEDGETFLENARKKARTVFLKTGKWLLADDSGLVVEALNGEPGVHSARYAGKQGDYEANNRKLLHEMRGVPDGRRQAYFTCTMVLIAPDGKEWDIEEHCNGVIARELKGSGGFGFDPLFYLPDRGLTMAELSIEEKNKISHRGKALRHMRKILEGILKKS